MASSWFLFFSYYNDARSNKQQDKFIFYFTRKSYLFVVTLPFLSLLPPVLHILRSTCFTYVCSPSLAFVQVFCPIGLSSTIIKQGRYIRKFFTVIIVNLPVLLFWCECYATQENTIAKFIALSQNIRLVNAVSDNISRD